MFPNVMPRQPSEQYYSEKELHEMVNRINAFASDYSHWKVTHARKEHQDLFGEVIKRREATIILSKDEVQHSIMW